MSTNNTFSLPRFMNLAKQNFIHNQKLLLLTFIGLCGGLFILFVFIQLSNDFQQGTNPEIFVPAFLTIFIGGGILFTGNAFPGFRAKEKTFSYLTLPASTLEKYVMEVLGRFLVLFIVIPALFWLMFHFEGFVFQLFISEASFEMIDISSIEQLGPDGEVTWWIKSLISGAILMAFLLAFTGAAHFDRFPLVKTLFAVAVLFFGTMGVMYVLLEQFGLGRYNPNERMWLWPRSGDQAVVFFSLVMWGIDLILIYVSFLKLKEKEV